METRNPLQIEQPIARRTMTVFFVVDTSGSMRGAKIQAVNEAIRGFILELSTIADGNMDSRICVSCLEFNSNTQWICEPTDVNDLHWTDLTTNGQTHIDKALETLNEKMSSGEFLPAPQYAPVIIILSDGEPSMEYQSTLMRLKANKWWQKAIRIAIAIGADANKNVLSDIVGNSEMVLTAYTSDMLKTIIRFVTIASSTIASRSSSVGVGTVGMESKQAEAIKQIKEFKQDYATELNELTKGF